MPTAEGMVRDARGWLGMLRGCLGEVVTRQEQMLRDIAAVQARIGKIDGELDDLAQLYKEDLLLGMGKPKWRRRS